MKMRSQELSDELAAFEKQGIQVANLSVPSGYVAIVLKALLYTKDLERDNLVLQADKTGISHVEDSSIDFSTQ